MTEAYPNHEIGIDPKGISQELIDTLFTEVAATGPEFFADETAELTHNLQRLKDKIYKLTVRETEGSTQSATRVVTGLLLAHRLVRRSDPDFIPSEENYTQVLHRIQAVRPVSKTAGNGKRITYFPALQKCFTDNPAIFDYLLEKFSNEDARWGAQILLLAIPTKIVVAPRANY